MGTQIPPETQRHLTPLQLAVIGQHLATQTLDEFSYHPTNGGRVDVTFAGGGFWFESFSIDQDGKVNDWRGLVAGEDQWYAASPNHRLYHLVIEGDERKLLTACGRELRCKSSPQQAVGTEFPRCKQCAKSQFDSVSLGG